MNLLQHVISHNPAARLTWRDTETRDREFTVAHDKVTHRREGTYPAITAPYHTPSLLEQMGVTTRFSNARAFVAKMQRDIEESRAQRTGVKVERKETPPVPAMADFLKVAIPA